MNEPPDATASRAPLLRLLAIVPGVAALIILFVNRKDLWDKAGDYLLQPKLVHFSSEELIAMLIALLGTTAIILVLRSTVDRAGLVYRATLRVGLAVSLLAFLTPVFLRIPYVRYRIVVLEHLHGSLGISDYSQPPNFPFRSFRTAAVGRHLLEHTALVTHLADRTTYEGWQYPQWQMRDARILLWAWRWQKRPLKDLLNQAGGADISAALLAGRADPAPFHDTEWIREQLKSRGVDPGLTTAEIALIHDRLFAARDNLSEAAFELSLFGVLHHPESVTQSQRQAWLQSWARRRAPVYADFATKFAQAHQRICAGLRKAFPAGEAWVALGTNRLSESICSEKPGVDSVREEFLVERETKLVLRSLLKSCAIEPRPRATSIAAALRSQVLYQKQTTQTHYLKQKKTTRTELTRVGNTGVYHQRQRTTYESVPTREPYTFEYSKRTLTLRAPTGILFTGSVYWRDDLYDAGARKYRMDSGEERAKRVWFFGLRAALFKYRCLSDDA